MPSPTRKELAKMLAEMPYGVLAGIAKELVEMNEDPEFDRDPRTPHGLATTLYDWGEAQQHDE